MAMVDVSGGMWYPTPISTRNIRGHTDITAGGANDEVVYIVEIPKTGSITNVAFQTGNMTVDGDGDVRIEGVTTSTGQADGSLIHANATGGFTITAATDDDIWVTVTLTAGVSVTQGDLVAVVLKNDGATPFTGSYGFNSTNTWQLDRPYIINTSGTKTVGSPCFGIEYSDGSYGNILGCTTVNLWEKATYSLDSTPDENGLRFKLAFKARVTGIWTESEIDGATNGFTIKFYDSDGSTVLTSITIDPDTRFAAANIDSTYYKFPASQVLDADTFYRITFLPLNNAADVISIGFDQFDSAAVMDAMEGGQNFHRTFRTDGGAWTDDTDARIRVSLHIDQVDFAAPAVSGPNAVSLLGGRTGGKQ